jgi:hypothetical protein
MQFCGLKEGESSRYDDMLTVMQQQDKPKIEDITYVKNGNEEEEDKKYLYKKLDVTSKLFL